MVSINWCKKQKKGIELVEPNDNLSEAYFSDADDSVSAMEELKGKWKLITAYYACYYAFYAILMKAGIKCEIHDCTLELMRFFGFDGKQRKFMTNLKKARIDVQYYRKETLGVDVNLIKSFVVGCKNLCLALDEDKIMEIRDLVKNA